MPAAREGLACPIYCLMPDHLHTWFEMGLRRNSDQLNGMAFYANLPGAGTATGKV